MGAPEGIGAEVQEHQGEYGGNDNLAVTGLAAKITAIFANGRAQADHREHQEEKSRNFEPQHASYPAGTAGGHPAGAVQRPKPAILTRPAPGNP